MGAICFSASINYLSKYSLYIVSYFHDIRFEVDHVWNIRGPQFKGQLGAQGDATRPRGLPPWELYVSLLQVII